MLTCCVNLIMFVGGFVILIVGTLPVSSDRVVEGWSARLLGLLAMVPLPLTLGIGFVYGFIQGLRGEQAVGPGSMPFLVITEIVITVLFVAAFFGLAFALAGPPTRVRRRRRRFDDYDDEDEDERPRRRHRDLDDEDDEDDLPPRRSRTVADEEEEEDRRKGRYRE